MAKVAPACVLVFLVLFAAILLASGQAGPQANMAPARGSQSSNAFRRPPHHKRGASNEMVKSWNREASSKTEYLWATSVSQLCEWKRTKQKNSCKQGQVLCLDTSVPKEVERVLSFGPKFCTEPRMTSVERLSVVKRISSKADEEDKGRCISEGVECLLKKRPPHHKRDCPRREVFKRCQSSSCGENKCYHLGQRRPLACTLDCVTGCFCKRRYYRNDNGKCVHRSQCRKIGIPLRPQLCLLYNPV
uniref:TIL domain-containing protein n=1 Tax=Amblyomma maculatum TaxID=34609 RepID=G3MKL4_AMBMU